MNYFVPESEAFSAAVEPVAGNDDEQQDNNDFVDASSVYQSPLDNRSTLPEMHYNNGGYSAPMSKRTFMPGKAKFGGFCDVCKLQLNSRIQSKSHYEGKPHAKKLKKAQEDAKKLEFEKSANETANTSTEEPPAKKARGMTALYCSVCDLSFTSEAHGKDHYLGRNHRRVLHGLAPYNTGPPDPRVSAQLLSSEPPEDTKGKPAATDLNKIRGKFHCELCQCSLTCQAQLDSHIKGAKHTKRLKQQQSGIAPPAPAAVPAAPRPAVAKGESSGNQFKCDVCNMMVNSSAQYEIHIVSKKHTLRITAQHNRQMATGHSAPQQTDDSPAGCIGPQMAGNGS